MLLLQVIRVIPFSVIPFSEPFTPENPPLEKDYNEYHKALEDCIAGEEY